MPIRSWLYVPGDRPDRLDKAADRGADALIVDLEDAVALANKDTARTTVADWLRSSRPGGVAVWVRINNEPDLLRPDIEAVAFLKPDGILLPKATTATVGRAVELLGGTDVALGVLLETAAGILDARAIAAVPAVTRMAVGEADLAADLSMDPSPTGEEWWPIRSQVILAAAAAGIEPPCGPVSTDFRDLDALRAGTEALRRAGFGSRSAIHPDQVAVINDVFTPTDAQVAEARALIDGYEVALADGSGVFTDERGRMVDEAVIRSARRLLG